MITRTCHCEREAIPCFECTLRAGEERLAGLDALTPVSVAGNTNAMPGSAEVRLLGMRIRTGDPKAVATVVAVLKKHKGDVTKAALELGVHRVTFYEWARVHEPLGALVDEHARGRIGRPPKKAEPKRKRAKKTAG